MPKPTITQDQIAALVSMLTGGGTANAAVAPTAVTRKVKRTAPAASASAKPATATDYSAYVPRVSSYEGFPTITFEAEGKRPISMGFSKVRIVLAHADALRKLVG